MEPEVNESRTAENKEYGPFQANVFAHGKADTMGIESSYLGIVEHETEKLEMLARMVHQRLQCWAGLRRTGDEPHRAAALFLKASGIQPKSAAAPPTNAAAQRERLRRTALNRGLAEGFEQHDRTLQFRQKGVLHRVQSLRLFANRALAIVCRLSLRSDYRVSRPMLKHKP